ncbi:hypothetical protein EJB05_49178 [Eragrostis curvula]|uniref:Uncharacterized protein n=1 Tax=Eragrostis curvula TaxID=38414 RepID=A0A5J9T3N9_9POAL|nr:hypothetical protein EJB05_53913 [Eragrostis curvula]TVU05980.1 hypothetical protein EJB05_49167 [Eragrostis curvula]TVU05991.1 hypothetical protein EJB05_49178 [Eragrostis curvula]
MALLPSDAHFFFRAAIAWTFSFTALLAIVRGWVGGRGFRAKKTNLGALVWSSLLAQDALRQRLAVRWNIPAEQPRRCSSSGGLPAVVELVLTDDAYIWMLVRGAVVCVFAAGVLAIFHGVGVAMAEAISWRMSPARPRERGRRGVRGRKVQFRLVLEIVLFISSVFSCVVCVPALFLEYMTAAARVRGCCYATVAVPCV